MPGVSKRAVPRASQLVISPIDTARAAIAAGEWRAAATIAREALASHESAEAHELLGIASWWLSDIETLFASRERAYQLYVHANEKRRAARIATWLDWDCRAFRGEPVVANGWLRRARRLLDDDRDCAEYGWLLMREADAKLTRDAPAAVTESATAAALGRRHGDADLEYVALSLEGLARVAAGQVNEGMQQLDEATAAVVGGEFADRSAAGVACCHLIMACELVRDFDRADQWCGRVREYCRQWNHPPLFAVCRTQYAGVLISSGAWKEADAELSAAIEELGAMRPGWIALGYLQLAELRRRQGRLDESRAMFERWPMVPAAWLGLGAIALERGAPADAERLAQRYLRQIPRSNHTARVAALELIVIAAAAGNSMAAATQAMTELQRLAESVESEPLRASVYLAAGALAAAQGDAPSARVAFAEAAARFDGARMPFDGLRARLMLAEQLQSAEHLQAARSETAAVIEHARQLGAIGVHDRAKTLSRTLHAEADAPSALTKRERLVLQHVARGLTNRQIASQLDVSQHTVHRHLGNIFTKLGLSSRAAAVAFAVRNGIAGSS